MNSFFIRTSVIIVIIIISGFITDCFGQTRKITPGVPDNLVPDEFEYFGKVIKCEEGELIWQKQLSLVMEYNERNNGIKNYNGLVLNAYRVIEKINSVDELEKIKIEIFNGGVYPKYYSSKGFDITTRDDISFDEFNLFMYHLLPTSKFFAYGNNILFEAGDVSAVELEWIYRGDRFNTIALVSDKKGIVYDHLLYFIHFLGSESEGNNIVIKTTSPKTSGNNTISYILQKADSCTNWMGRKTWKYEINIKVYGEETGGKKQFSGGFSCNASVSNSGFGYTCEASVYEIANTIRDLSEPNKYITFVYKWSYNRSAGPLVNDFSYIRPSGPLPNELSTYWIQFSDTKTVTLDDLK